MRFALTYNPCTPLALLELSADAGDRGDGPLALLARANRGTYRLVPLAPAD